MKEHHLTSNMRNSTEIHKLVEATKEVLKDKQTVFIHPKDSKIGDESRKKQENEEVSEEKDISKKQTKQESQEELENKRKLVENHSDYKMENRGENKESSGENSTSDEPETEAEHESERQPEKKKDDSVMGLDEAQAILGSSMENDIGGKSTRSNFAHAEVDNIGHKIETEKPLLFELGDEEEFQRGLSLVAIFTKLIKSKHVVLHFDTKPNAIPSALRFVFDYYFDGKKETTNFKEFETNKKVLVCSYPAFRGLEYPRIAVLIDRDIYFQQHYLVEMLTRCTSQLFVVALKNSSALTNVLEKWKNEELVNQWKAKISTKKNQTKDIEFSWDDEQRIINGTIRPKYYDNLEKAFKSSSIISETTDSIRVRTAQETINQQG